MTAVITLKRRLPEYIFIILVFFCGILALRRDVNVPGNHLSHIAVPPQVHIALRGRVMTDPEVRNNYFGRKRTDFVLAVTEVLVDEKWISASGKIKTSLYFENPQIVHGSLLELVGNLEKINAYSNPGCFDYGRYLSKRDIAARLICRNAPQCLILNDNRKGYLPMIFAFKDKLKKIISDQYKGPSENFIKAVMLGDRAGIDTIKKEHFLRAGSMHLLAISGLHVGIILTLVLFLLHLLPVGRRTTFVLVCVFLASFAVMTGARPSIIRSSIMSLLALFAFTFKKEANLSNVISLAMLLMLYFWPRQIFDAGFQLSFAAVISLSIAGDLLRQREKNTVNSNRFLRFAKDSLIVSAAVWIGVWPLTAKYFNIVSVIGIFSNLLLIPLTFMALIGAILSTALSLASGVDIKALIIPTEMTIELLYKINGWMAGIKGGHFFVKSPSVFLIVFYYAGIAAVIFWRRERRKLFRVAIALIVFLNIWMLAGAITQIRPNKLEVTFLDVGNADATFIRFPNGNNMLVDGARALLSPSGEAVSDQGRDIIRPFLLNQGIRRINAVIATHMDSDHTGGLLSVLEDFEVEKVFDNGIYDDSLITEHFRESLKDVSYKPLDAGDRLTGFGEAEVEVLQSGFDHTLGDNENSIVLRISYGRHRILLPGDISGAGLKNLIEKVGPKIECTLLKAPHHGGNIGKYGTVFYERVEPELIVVSGRRMQPVFARHNTLTTAQSGAIIAKCDKKTMQIRQTRSLPEKTPSKRAPNPLSHI